MKPTIKDTATILGIIGSAGIGSICSIPILSVFGGAMTSTLMGELKTRKLERWFIETHPDNLNHSIKKLFIASVSQSLHNILIKFEDTNPEKVELKEAKNLIHQLQKDIPSKLSSTTDQYLSDDKIRDYLSAEINEDNAISKELHDLKESLGDTTFCQFLINNLSQQIHLCFFEGLKDPENNDAWVAYTNIVSEEIRQTQKIILAKLETMLSQINDIRDDRYKITQEKIEDSKIVLSRINDESYVKTILEESLNKIQNSIEDVKKNNELGFRRITVNRKRWVRLPLITIPCIIIAILAYYYFQPFNSTIVIYGWNKNAQLPNSGSAFFELHIKNEIKVSEIDSQGKAVVYNIPGRFRIYNLFKISIINKDGIQYYLKDTLVSLKKNKISYLQVSINGIEALNGEVFDSQTNEPIVGAEIRVGHLITRTNKNGSFGLNIPLEEQKVYQEITVSKKGYKNYRKIIPLINREIFRILLSSI